MLKIQIIDILARSAKYCDNRHMLLFQVLLVAEREENDVTKKAHTNAQERNEELNRKVQDADEMIKQLNDIVKRFAVVFNCLSFSILYLVDCTESFLLHKSWLKYPHYSFLVSGDCGDLQIIFYGLLTNKIIKTRSVKKIIVLVSHT